LEFFTGSSESLEVSRELVSRISSLVASLRARLYVVLGWFSELFAAREEVFPDCVGSVVWFTRSEISKASFSKRHWASCHGLFARLRSVQGIDAAEEVFCRVEIVP